MYDWVLKVNCKVKFGLKKKKAVKTLVIPNKDLSLLETVWDFQVWLCAWSTMKRNVIGVLKSVMWGLFNILPTAVVIYSFKH